MLDPAIVPILTLGTGTANIAKRRFEFVALVSVLRRKRPFGWVAPEQRVRGSGVPSFSRLAAETNL